VSQEEKEYQPGDKRLRDDEQGDARENVEVQENEDGEPQPTEQDVQDLLELGGLLLTSKQFQEAENVFNLILQVTTSTDALFFRGLSKFYLGQNAEALVDIRAAITQEPDPERKLFFQEKSPLETKQLDEPEILVRRGLDALLWGAYPQAIGFYNESIARRSIAKAFWGRGLAQFLSGNLDGCLNNLQQAIDGEQDPNEKSFFKAEKLFVLDAVGEFSQTRALWRSVKLSDNHALFVLRYAQLKSIVCSDDIDVEEVKEAAENLFRIFSKCSEVVQEKNIKTFLSVVRLLEKYIFTLSGRDAEALDIVNFVSSTLLKHIRFILEKCSVPRSNNKISLYNWVFERLLKRYFTSLSCFLLGVRQIPGVVAAVNHNFKTVSAAIVEVKFNDPSIFDQNPDSENSLKSFLTLVSKMSSLDSVENEAEEEENLEQKIRNADEKLQAVNATPRIYQGTPREIFQQIQERNRGLLHGGYGELEKMHWRINHAVEFLHMLPEFSGEPYQELFFTVKHELLVAHCRYVKIQWLEGGALVRESQELIQKCEQIFTQYQDCVAVIEEQNDVRKRVARNGILFFRYELLDDLLFGLTHTAKKLLEQSLDLNLVRQILTLALTVSKECSSILSGEDLAKRLLWDDNVLPQRAKDFVREHAKNAALLKRLQDFDLKIREQEELARTQPLTLLYGKNTLQRNKIVDGKEKIVIKNKTIIAIPFSPNLSPSFLAQGYDRNNIDKAKNLMFGFDFALTFSADCDGGRKYYVKHVQIRVNDGRPYFKYEDAATVCKVVGSKVNETVLKNMRDGLGVHERETRDQAVVAKQLLIFKPHALILQKAKAANIDKEFHEHSEQAGIFWLMNKEDEELKKQKIERLEVATQLIGALKNDLNFQRNGKLGSIEIDMISDKSSCDSCKLSLLALQASEGPESFRAKLSQQLNAGGVRLAKKGLLIGSRVLSRQPYDWDSQKGRNPTDNHVANLKNLSIFQFTQPALFMSGNNPQTYQSSKQGPK
jgi:tetratricopeptide (TPR) repeat protein